MIPRNIENNNNKTLQNVYYIYVFNGFVQFIFKYVLVFGTILVILPTSPRLKLSSEEVLDVTLV